MHCYRFIQNKIRYQQKYSFFMSPVRIYFMLHSTDRKPMLLSFVLDVNNMTNQNKTVLYS